MKGKHLPLIVLFIGILMSLNLAPLTNAQPYLMAKFTSVKVIHAGGENELVDGGTVKVYDNLPMLLNLRFYNENIQPSANLYTKIYIDNTLQRISDNYPIPWKGTGLDIWFTTSSDPATHHWKVELWWGDNLEDAKEFDVQVVRLYVENWSPASLTVEKGKIAPSSWSISFKNGGNDNMENVSISVDDNAGLEITPQSQNWDNIIAGETKSISFLVKAPFTLPIGPRTVTFQIIYVDFMGISHTETMSAPVSVDKLSTSITLTLDPSSVKKDSSSTFTAKLVDGNGNPMANQAISFFVENTSIGSVNTDSSGNAVTTYTANVDAGTYAVNASFAETDDYKQSSATTNLTVEPFETTIVLDVLPSSVMLGDTVTIKATLKDEKNNLLEDMDVEFQINEKNAWKTIGSAKTDSSGIASLQYKTSTAGTLQVKAIFAGATNYENSSAIAELVVGESIALKLGITVAVVAVVIVGLLIFASKRGMKIPFMGRKEEISPPSSPEEG